MAVAIDRVVAGLRSVVARSEDDYGFIDYVAHIIHPELNEDTCMSNEASFRAVYKEKIEDLLLDCGLLQNKSKCIYLNLYKAIKEDEGGSLAAPASRKEKLEQPTTLQELINVNVLRQVASTAASERADMLGENSISVPAETSGGYEDPFLGLEKGGGNFNVVMPIEESMKLARAAAKRREKQLRLMRQWEKSRVPLPPPRRRHGDKEYRKITDIVIPNFSVAVAGRELLKDAHLKIAMGRIYGLIGRNGIGKTTFISAFVRHDISGLDEDLNIGCVEQEFEYCMNLTPLEVVLKCDEERESLLAEEKILVEDESKQERLNWVYGRLGEIEADRAPPEACRILSGLRLSEKMYKETKLKELSGGWRMRVMLAKTLFADPDILCLDEPTNHLDIHAVAWLTDYLKQSNKTCIVVSHARQFLNDVCTDVIEFKDRQLKYYSGNYDVFERAKAEKEMHLQRQIENQEAQRAHMQKFIDKMRYKASSAAMAQSRIKALAKLPMLEKITSDPSLQFKFTNPTELPTPMLLMQGVSFAWDKASAERGDFLLRDVDFSADLQTRAAICGVNGSGKSTFLKLLLDEIQPSAGFVFRHSKLRIGYFAQHHVDGLDLTKNAVQQLQNRYPDAKLNDEQARSFLGKFGISGMMALEPLFILSGGQKSRVAIAVMAFAEPHILVMDEPTNHLDLDAVQALIAALNEFEGGVIIVSHDAHLISCMVTDLWHVDPVGKTMTKFKADFEEYQQLALKRKI